jgi:putative transcriptional regulator
MMKKLKYRSDISEAIHSSVAAMYSIGTIDKATMREFDESCLAAEPPIKPHQIKLISRIRRTRYT